MPRLGTLDALRGLTILWVVVMHFAADTRGLPAAEVAPGVIASALARGEIAEALGRVLVGVLFLPGFRLDVLLFVTGLVLELGRPRPASALLARRAQAILPGYWLGTLLVAAVIVACALTRSMVTGALFEDEVQFGSRLARVPYEFAPSHLLYGLSVMGRFTSPGTVQVVAPSLWYIALMAQFYVAYPVMRAVLRRLGPAAFLVACGVVMVGLRVLLLTGWRLGPFDTASALAAFLPFRLVSPALGMVAAPWFRRRAGAGAARLHSTVALVPAVLLLLLAGWIGSVLLPPARLLVVIGPSLAVVPAVMGLWALASWALARPGPARVLLWAGRTSLAMLVVQDALRFVVGTAQSLGAPLAQWMWVCLPVYVMLTIGLTKAWAPVSQGVTDWWRADGAARAAPGHCRDGSITIRG